MKFYINTLVLLLFSGALAGQCLQLQNCPSATVAQCDLTANNAGWWNESYWQTPGFGLHDMPEGPVELCFSATDPCSGANIGIQYRLFLDLDHNGTQETVVNSAAPPPPGTVWYDSLGTGGSWRNFDSRPVAVGDKYNFAVELSGTGASRSACVRWNTTNAPGTFTLPELPYGTHSIRWIVENGLGETDSCEYQFEVKDCKKPTVVCNSNLAVNIMSTGQITLWDSDFVQILDDNATPASLLVLAIRKAGTGTGFPVDTAGNPQHSVTFDCDELGNQFIELWAKDLAGNSDYCETYVNVQDNSGICSPDQVTFNLELCADTWCTNTPVTGVEWGIFVPNLQTGISLGGINAAGCLEVDSTFNIFPASIYYFYPDKNTDPLNGVDVLDIIKTAQHILGVTPLASPYAMVAADVNKSSSITSFDMVESLKLLAGIYTEFPSNTSWRFIPKTYVFPNPNNPFIGQYPAGVELVNAQGLVEGNAEFWAIKVGDVDCSSFPGLTAGADDRSVRLLQAPDRELQAGETFDWPVYPTEAANWLGFQLELMADPARLQVDGWAAGGLPNWQESSILQASPGQINAVWYDVIPASLAAHQPLFVLRLKALQRLRLSEALSLNTRRIPAKVYDSEFSGASLQLRFEPGLSATPAVGEPWPNPSASGFSLAVQAPESTPVDLDVLDLQGRLLWQYRSATSGTLHIPADIFPASGAYLWRLRAGNLEQSGKLMVREK